MRHAIIIYIIQARIKPDKKGHVMVRNRYIFMDMNPSDHAAGDLGMNVDINRFLEQANNRKQRINYANCEEAYM